MNIILRPEQPADYNETERMLRQAFWNLYCPGCCEHYLLHIMRAHPAFLPQLDIVAVVDGKIAGNVVYLKSIIKADDGGEHAVLSLGPIAVLPKYQGMGIGARLIEHSIALAAKMDFKAVLLCGDPDYYRRQGFVAAETLKIRTAENMYFAALQVRQLHANALAGITGRYFENEIYNVDEAAMAAFDKNFPAKEMLADTVSQKRFQRICAMRKSAV